MEDPKIGSVNFEIQVHSNFYFYFLSLIKIEFNRNVATAGLLLDGIDFKININPEFWNSIKVDGYKKNQFLLLHELYHIIFKHFSLHKEYDDKTLFNIATDCYINYELIELIFKDKQYFIEGGVWYEDIGVPSNTVKEGSDSIYRYLLTSNNENFKSLYNQVENSSKTLLIDHDLWKQIEKSEIDAEILAKALSSSVDNLMKEANSYSKDMGFLPASVRRLIDELFKRKESKINWKKQLRNFISLYSNKIFVKKSFTKPSKYFDDATTMKIKFKPKIAVIIDTSGSMTNLDIVDAFTELSIISKRSEFDIKVIECDADITNDSIYDYKNIETVKNRMKSKGIVGGGGTVVDPAILHINRNCKDVASIIYITDGYVDPPKVNPLKPFIVILTSKGLSLERFKNNWRNKFKILKIDEV